MKQSWLPVTSVPVPFHTNEADVFRQSSAREFCLENQCFYAQYFSEPAYGEALDYSLDSWATVVINWTVDKFSDLVIIDAGISLCIDS